MLRKEACLAQHKVSRVDVTEFGMTEFGGDRDKPTSHRLVHSTFTAEIEKEAHGP
jgi:hypothetical protein